MPGVLVPLASGFEEIEAVTVIDVLRRAGIEVVTAGLIPGPVTGARGITLLPDRELEGTAADRYDMIILPGGQPGTDNLNADPRIHSLLQSFNSSGKLIGAICAAPMVLAAAGILEGRRATSYPACAGQLAGAVHTDSPVVIDGTLITSQGVGTALDFALSITARLAGAERAAELARAMVARNPLIMT